jgi:hypothetical protein
MVRIFIACEDRHHAFVAQWLVDEMVVGSIDWLREFDLDPDQPAGFWKSDDRKTSGRLWAGRDEGEEWFDLHGWKDALADLKIGRRDLNLHGHVAGRPAGPDVKMVRACLLLAQHLAGADVAVIVRDVDTEPERCGALLQLREANLVPGLIAITGYAVPEVEAWFLAGFRANSEDESDRIRQASQRLSFDPTREPHKLSSQGHPPDRDAKDVFHEVLGASATERDCWKRCMKGLLETVDDRGRGCGASSFLDSIRRDLLPWVHERLGGTGPRDAIPRANA